ncbi:MAG: acylphosphatase [Patescibacteria group bacterium]
MEENLIERQYKIFGRVQMVMFRDFATRKANKFGIGGFVRNEKDGSVLVLAQGAKDKLSLYEEYLKKGSLFARVDNLEKKEIPITKRFNSFEIIYE